MKRALPVRLLGLGFGLLVGMLVTGSSATPLVVTTALTLHVTLPWAMSGCWEHELFTRTPTTSVALQSGPQK